MAVEVADDATAATTGMAAADAPKAVAAIAIKAVEAAAGFAANDGGNFCGQKLHHMHGPLMKSTSSKDTLLKAPVK